MFEPRGRAPRQKLRKRTQKSVKTTVLHLAIRETQKVMSLRLTQTVICAVAIVLGIAGPFGTEDVMRLVPRIVYWLVVSQITFASGTFVSELVQSRRLSSRLPAPLMSGLTGLVIGVVISAEIFLINIGLFGISPLEAGYALPLLLNVLVVAVVVSVAISLAVQAVKDKEAPQPQEAAPQTAAHPKLVDRLPFDKRGALISVSVNDHYVDVTTTKGTEMLLMRLADAISEAGLGLQVHRSHWVSTDHIASVTRDGAKAVIKTSDGRDIPVSRTYVPKLKEAGFLP
mgnify:CR=1 FL=1